MSLFWQICLPTFISLGVSLLSWIAIKVFDWGRLANKIETLKDDMKDVKEISNEVKESLLLMKGGLVQAGVLKEAFLTKPRSPIELTETGKTALQDSGFIDLIEDKKPELLERIRKANPQTKYDLQNVAENILRSDFVDAQTLKKFKIFVFKTSTSLGELLDAGAVYIREELAQELGITQ